jgi:SNF2 family DNA or RNA helicase
MNVACQYVPIAGPGADPVDVGPEDALPAAEPETASYGGPHTKTKELLRDIREMKAESKAFVEKGEAPLKCVVFSEFTSHLDLIQRALSDNNYECVRIDGTMNLSKRRKVLDTFNSDDSVTILLASIKAAGQGLNLTAASRAFIMEPMWNPAAEEQAVDRIHRIGQKREVMIRRYHMARSVELKIMELKKKKQALADVSMNRNHKQLSKEEIRKQHMKDILSLFK